MQAASRAEAAAGQNKGNRRKQKQPHRSCLDSALASGSVAKPSQPAHARQLKVLAGPAQQADQEHVLAGAAGHADAGPASFLPPFLQQDMPAQQPLPAGDASTAALAGYTDTAPAGKPQPRRKRAAKASKDGFYSSCSFCSTTESPLWRNGPAQYPRLCNACGIRYARHLTGKTGPRTNPFSAKTLAVLHKKAAAAAARAALTCSYQHTAAPVYAAPAPMGSSFSQADVSMAAAAADRAYTMPAAAEPASGNSLHEASAVQEQQWAQGLAVQSMAAGQSAGQEWGLQEQEVSTQAGSHYQRSSKKLKRSSSSDTNTNNQQSVAEQPAAYAAAAPVSAPAAQELSYAVLQQLAALLQALPTAQHNLQELLYQQQPSSQDLQSQPGGMVASRSSLGASQPAGEQGVQRGSHSTSTAAGKAYSTTSLDSVMTVDLPDGVKTDC